MAERVALEILWEKAEVSLSRGLGEAETGEGVRKGRRDGGGTGFLMLGAVPGWGLEPPAFLALKTLGLHRFCPDKWQAGSVPLGDHWP